MPKFVEQATTYGYGKASPYVDTACEKVPPLQDIIKRLVPYAKPSIQLADKIVDRVLELASKPIQIAQGTATSIGRKATECKEVIAKNVSRAKESVSATIVGVRASAVIVLKQLESLLVEKKSSLMHAFQNLWLTVHSKLGHVSAWTSKKIQAFVARLRLKEMWGMACEKAIALKESVSEAWKNHAPAFAQQGVGKAHASIQRVLGSGQVDKPNVQDTQSTVEVDRVTSTKTTGSEDEMPPLHDTNRYS